MAPFHARVNYINYVKLPSDNYFDSLRILFLQNFYQKLPKSSLHLFTAACIKISWTLLFLFIFRMILNFRGYENTHILLSLYSSSYFFKWNFKRQQTSINNRKKEQIEFEFSLVFLQFENIILKTLRQSKSAIFRRQSTRQGRDSFLRWPLVIAFLCIPPKTSSTSLHFSSLLQSFSTPMI